MAENIFTRFREDFVHCTICTEPYNEPKMLPCLHSFCLPCLERWARNSHSRSFSCPKCRRKVDLPRDGVCGLPHNFFLVSLMERLEEINRLSNEHQDYNCNICRNGNDTMFCLDCKMHICLRCKVTHDRLTRSSDHPLIPSDKLSDENYLQSVLSNQAPFCDSHKKEKVRYYCTQCSQLACQVCATVSHQSHQSIQEVERMVPLAKAQLENLLETSKCDTVDARKTLEVAKKATGEIESQISVLRRKVDSHYDKICKKLRSDKEKLTDTLQRIQEKQSAPIRNIERDVSDWLNAMENTQEMTRAILQQNNAWEILQMKSELVESLDRLKKERNIKRIPTRMTEIIFEPAKLGLVDKYQKRAANESERTSSWNLFEDNFVGEVSPCILL
ncbi:E3 ubiquitin-protein ligase TRIM56 [Holothuria leucospilota]|uniref:E3 ubiquitin-protein ligase TRIM56 n=1 Tax=Holothuria leucospilota TaxID=206669 RepID=A0A9Q1BUB2_HOLLE|nr:E3 ubiquitin-protein ligase TRIM56 [Holothuria leucospilota]